MGGIGERKERGGRVLSEYFDDDYDDREDNNGGKKMQTCVEIIIWLKVKLE